MGYTPHAWPFKLGKYCFIPLELDTIFSDKPIYIERERLDKIRLESRAGWIDINFIEYNGE